MESSGEWFIENQNLGRELYLQHMGRYLFATSYLSGKTVLDAACGSGFGSEILSLKAKKVFGIDNNCKATQYCKANYKSRNLFFVQMDCNSLAFQDSFFDIIISFETLEHVQDVDAFLQELNRVLKKNGLLILSTPNRENFAIYTKRIKNPFHVKEFSENEFVKMIGKYFKLEDLLGQKFFAKKDVPLLTQYTDKQVPYSHDSIIRRLIRIGLRIFLSEKARTKFFLRLEVWANKCKVGDIIPTKAVYLIGISRKIAAE